MKVAFYTLGCKVNQYETQALKEKFTDLNYQIVGEQDYADVYVINTCTVTNLAERKSRQYIRRMKKINPNSVVAVIGCYVQVNPQEVKAIEGVDIIVGTNEKSRLPEYVEAFMAEPTQICHVRKYEDLNFYEETGTITSMESRTRAYIKVQEGCNQFCSYCIIPYARGRIRSRNKEEILYEAKKLIGQGFKELVITGINTALYGRDQLDSNQFEEVNGIEVIVKQLNELSGDFRIRLGSLEPTVINASYVKRLLKYEKLCPHMHLSLQSGSDRILALMNRHYNREGYSEIVNILRDFDPGYGLTTDIIVGFPGERETDFQDSVEMVKEIRFNKVHVFPYSIRQGTKAAEMSGQISAGVKKARSILLTKAGEKASEEFLKSCIGSIRQVLYEEYHEKDGTVSGYSDNYIKVYHPVSGPKEAETLLNRFVKTEFQMIYKEGIKGVGH